jgi:hypothetical protein
VLDVTGSHAVDTEAASDGCFALFVCALLFRSSLSSLQQQTSSDTRQRKRKLHSKSLQCLGDASMYISCNEHILSSQSLSMSSDSAASQTTFAAAAATVTAAAVCLSLLPLVHQRVC